MHANRDEAFEDVLRETGDKHLIRKGGRVTLNAEAYAPLASLPAGARTPLMEDEVGVSFYEIERHTPAFTRDPFPRKQYNEQAEILKKTDQLPSAYRVAQQLSDLWVSFGAVYGLKNCLTFKVHDGSNGDDLPPMRVIKSRALVYPKSVRFIYNK